MSVCCALLDPSGRLAPAEKERLLAAMCGQDRAVQNTLRFLHSEDGRFSCAAGADHCAAGNREGVLSVIAGAVCPSAQENRTSSLQEALNILSEEPFVPCRLALLDGPFTFFRYAPEHGLVAACDFFGVRPVYWYAADGVTAFATSLRSLWALPFFTAIVDSDSLAEYLSCGGIAAPGTFYAGVRKLPPARWALFRAGSPEDLGRYGAFTPGLSLCEEQSVKAQAARLSTLVRESAALWTGTADAPVPSCEEEAPAAPPATRTGRAAPGGKNCLELFPRAAAWFERLEASAAHAVSEPSLALAGREVCSAWSAPAGQRLFSLAGSRELFTDPAGSGPVGLFPDPGAPDTGETLFEPEIFAEEDLRELLGVVPERCRQRQSRLRVSSACATWLHPCHWRRRMAVERRLPAVAQAVSEAATYRGQRAVFPVLTRTVLRFAEQVSLDAVQDTGQGSLLLQSLDALRRPAAAPPGPEATPPEESACRGPLWRAPLCAALATSADLEKIFAPRSMRLLRENLERYTDRQLAVLFILACYLRHAPVSAVSPLAGARAGSCTYKPVRLLAHDALLSAALRLLDRPVLLLMGSGAKILSTQSVPGNLAVGTHVPEGTDTACRFDWERETDWSVLKPLVRPNAVACVKGGEIPDYSLRRRLVRIGIEHAVIFEGGKTYLLPTRIPGWKKRLRTIWLLFRLSRSAA